MESNTTILYDDYNSVIPRQQSICGTITRQIGSPCRRNGYKIIVIENGEW